MAIITLSHANLLVLDEPTNHLDVENIEALEDALTEYEGTVLLVSHDRAFLREVATRVWAFEGDRLTDFDGSFVEWEVSRMDKASQVARIAEQEAEKKKAAEKEKSKKNASAQADDHSAKRAKKSAAADAEQAVARWEAQVTDLEDQLADPELYDGSSEAGKKAARLDQELAKARKALDEAMAAWADATS
jgi:ATP-binding cassette subfamily F protein 3